MVLVGGRSHCILGKARIYKTKSSSWNYLHDLALEDLLKITKGLTNM